MHKFTEVLFLLDHVSCYILAVPKERKRKKVDATFFL